MTQKMLVGDRDTVLLIPAYEIAGVPQLAHPGAGEGVPITTPSASLLNYWIDTLVPDDEGASWGGNVTCSVIDDWNLAMTESERDDTRTLCSVGQSQDLTFYNYDAVMNFLRDVDPQDETSEFNLPLQLLLAPDLAYVIAHRKGYSRTDSAVVGQEWHFFYVWTDHTIPAAADEGWLGFGQTFISKGIVHFKHTLGV